VIDGRLVILDDDRHFAEFLCEVTKGIGLDVEVTCTRAEFQRALDSFRPSIILLDLHMPDSDGVEILHFLGERESRARVLLLSGYDPRVIRSAERMGRELGLNMLGVLQKPMSVADLEAILEPLVPERLVVTREMLRAAFDHEQLRMVYQPKVDLGTRRVVGLEGLSRWRLPGHGILGPQRFLRVMESERLLGELVTYTTRLAAQQLVALGEELAPSIAVNLAPELLADADLPDRLAAIVRTAGAPPERLTFEVTESQAMSDPLLATEVLSRLRLKGFRTSLDDFGTGYSSLVWLHRLPFCELKIDRMFVSEAATSPEAEAIVRTTVDLANSLRLSTCAEGVETAATWEKVIALGCNSAQGYLISPPLEPDEIAAWTSRWRATP
jgi:EAL domain-containing protein (putative c-di-GMP-specific phosphodiesterase class I)